MAVENIILGKNVNVFIDGVLVGCATDFSVSGSAKEINTTCAGSGDVEQKEVGRKSYTWDTSSLWRQTTNVGTSDIATNVTAYEMFTKFQNGASFTVVFKDSTLSSGDIVYTGIGYATSVKYQGTVDSVEKFTCSGFFNEFVSTREV